MWIVDPLDGTTNYKTKIPFFNVSIALAKHKIPIAAVVFAPVTNEMYSAERGKRAFLNDNLINVSSTKRFDSGVIGFCHSFERVHQAIGIYSKLKELNNRLKQVGAAALELAYVAAGRLDAFFMIGVNSWDVAAGQLLVESAGGKVTDFEGKPFTTDSDFILATNGLLHEQLRILLNNP
jgi:myo-inositol-1(or 4)-monophosphatase